MIVRPRLFVDIDGVIYAHYGGYWQIRPYTKTLIQWAAKHFDIYFLSFNSQRKEVWDVLRLPGQIAEFPKHDGPAIGKLRAIIHNGGLEGDWFMIEDENPDAPALEILREAGIANRWIVVPDTGGDVLLDVKHTLEHWLETKKVIVPAEWHKKLIRRDLSSLKEWSGPYHSDEETQKRLEVESESEAV